MLILQSLLAQAAASSPVVVSPYPLYAWGVNTTGKLGINNNTTQSYHVQVQSGTSWKSFSTSINHSLGVKADGTLWAWGSNDYGQIGINVKTGRRTSLDKFDNTSWTIIKTDTQHSVGLKSDGSLWTWGVNASGQLGTNDVITRSSPVQIGTSSWTTVDAGANFTVAVKSGGTLWAWGIGTGGQLGINAATSRSSPTQIGALTTWSKVAAGSAAVIASTTDNNAYVWGSSTTGNLILAANDSFPLPRSSPVAVAFQPFDGALAAAAISQGTVLIDKQYRLWAWGGNTYFGLAPGVLGTNDTFDRSSPVLVNSTGSWTMISGKSISFAGIKSDGSLWTWGYNAQGQLGTNDTRNRSSPTQIGTSSWTMVSAGNYFMVAINVNGQVFCWGSGGQGSLGNNAAIDRSSPVQISSTSSFNFVSAGNFHTLARTINNKLWTWGINNYGQLGANLGVGAARSSPVAIGTTTSWIALSAGGDHSAGVTSAGTLFTWGSNNSGALGNSATINRSSPIQIGALATWTKVEAGQDYTLAMTESAGTATVYHWGANAGRAGNGTTAATSSPVSVYSAAGTPKLISSFSGGATYIIAPDDTLIGTGENSLYSLALVDTPLANTTTWKVVGHSPPGTINSVSAGPDHAAVIAGNKLWSLGWNDYGQYMNGTIVTRSRAVLADSSKTWLSAEAGYYATLGITTDGKLWSSGYNIAGQLGLGDVVNRSSPTQVGTSSWTMVSLSKTEFTTFAAGVTTDGKLWGWSRNYDYLPLGVLGDTGVNTNRSAPVQIGSSTNWSSVSVEAQTAGTLNDALIVGVNSLGEAYWQGNGTDFAINDTNKISPVQVGTDTDWEYVSAGGGSVNTPHSFAMKTNKTLWAWGSNTYGNLGLNLGANLHRSSPTQVTAGPANGSWTTVAGGFNFAYGIDTSGKLWTWGYNYTGGGLGLGVGDVTYYTAPQLVTKQRSFTAVSAPYNPGSGNYGATVIDSLNDQAWSWGGGTSGITALGNTTTYYSPTLVPSTSWRVISSGQDFAVGVKADGTLWSWGGNVNGQLGKNSTVGSLTPAQIMTGSSFTTVSAAEYRAYAISTAGQLFAWGYNSAGNAWNDGNARSSPVQIGSSSWSAIASGHKHDVGLTIDGSMYAWGDNSIGQHGLNDDLYINRSSPTLVATSVSKVFAGKACTSYIDGLSRLFYAGTDLAGAAGRSGPFFNPILGYMNEPFNETLGAAAGSWTMVAFGYYPNFESSYSTALGVKSDGSLWAWGNNNAGTIGDGTTVNRFRNPQKIGSSSWSFVAVNNQVAAAIDTAGRLFTWGVNTDGKLGQNSVASRSSPVQVAGSWNFVAIGQSSVAAIKTDGTLWTWGGNANGQLGVSDTINRSSPVQVAGAWTMVAFSGASSNESKSMIGIKTNGQVYTWGLGSNQNSYLGGSIGARNEVYGIDRSSPVSIGAPLTYTGISATSVSASDYGTSLIRMSDGNLLTWGNGIYLNQGHGDQVNRSWPTVVGQTLSWSVLSMGIDHVAAVRSDGSLWSWGLNTDGRLGTNDTNNRSSPVQVGSLTNWSDVSAGGAHTLARKTDGTLWAWGSNGLGRLGDGTTINKSSPIQIGTSSWSAISTGNAGSAGISAFRLFVWGDDSLGRLGLNTSNVHQSSPVQLGTSSWSAVSVGEPHMLAIRTDGALFAWGGDAGYGCLGLDISTSRSSPIQVGTSSWSQVSAGYYGSMGITTATSLWAWGSNSQGRLGVGDVRNRSVPTQVGALTGWTALGKTLITEVNTAIRGSALYAMGAVDSITGDRSSPVLVGVGDWKNSCTTQYYHLAIYNKTMILTEGHLNTPYVLGNNSTTTNSWNTSSRTIMEGTKGHRAYPDGPWSNNSHMLYGTTKAVKTDGTLWAWGDNSYYQIATKDAVNRSSPTQIGTATSWRTTSVAVKTLGFTILGEMDTTGKVWTWGVGNNSGSMVNPLQSFTQIPGSWSMVSYARQDYPTQAGIKTDGTLWTWGYGQSGSTGLGSITARSSPTQVGTKNDWTHVASGENTVIAVGDYGQVVYAWGYRPGAFSINSTSSPVALFGPNFSAKELAPSMLGSHTMVLSTAGSLYAIGAGKDGAFGDGLTTTSAYVPIKIDNGTWKKIATGNSHTLGLKTDSTLWAWGLNTSGQLGIQDAVSRSSPVQVMAGKSFTAIGAGANGFSQAIDTVGTMWAFGLPTGGVLGISSTIGNRSLPVQVGENWSSASAGLSHVALIDSEGGLWVWGAGPSGELGTNDVLNRPAYTKIGNSSWLMVSAGDSSTHGITADGRLWAWGDNANGNLGLNDTINRSSPTQVGTSSWSFVSSRTSFTAAISSTGKLWAWGNNSTGTLGDNTTINRSSPVQVTGVGQTSSFAIVKVGGTTAAAITINGALYAWGTASGTGQNSSVNRSEPVLVSSDWTTDPNKITVKLSNVIAIKSDGTLWAWGDNTNGILGTGNAVARSSPTQIGTSSWTAVQGAQNVGNRASAIDATGRAFAWGTSSGNGQLGTGDTIARSSPTLITGSRSFSTILHTSVYVTAIEAGTRDRYIWGAPGTFTGLGSNPGTRSDPTFIAEGRVGSWVSVNSGYDSVLATKTE